MLRIVIDGQEAYTRSLSLQVVKTTQYRWIDEDISFVFKFDLPVCDQNNKIFQYAHKLHSPVRDMVSYPAQVFKNGHLLMKGILKIAAVTHDSYSVFMGLERELFKELIRGRKTTDYNYGGVIPFAATTLLGFVTELIQKGTDVNNPAYYIFPVKNDFMELDQLLNNEIFQNSTTASSIGVIGPGSIFVEPQVFTPFFRIGWILQHIFQSEGYFVKYNFLNDHPEFSRACQFSNEDIFGDYNVSSTSFSINPVEHIKEMDVEEYVESVQNFFNLDIYFDLETNSVEIRNNQMEGEISKSVVIDGHVSPEYEAEVNQTKGGIIKWEMKEYYLKPGGYTFELPANVISTANPNTILNPKIGQLVWDRTAGMYKYYTTIHLSGILGWRVLDTLFYDDQVLANNFSNSLAQCTFGEPGERPLQFNSKAGHPMMKDYCPYTNPDSIGGGFNDYIRAPWVYVGINSQQWPADKVECPLLFMLYRGIQRTIYGEDNGINYIFPMGNTDLYHHDQNLIAGFSCSLKMDNDEQLVGSGIIKKLWGNLIDWIKKPKRDVIRYKWITAQEYASIDQRKTYRIDQTDYLIRKIEVDFESEKKYSLAKLYLIQY